MSSAATSSRSVASAFGREMHLDAVFDDLAHEAINGATGSGDRLHDLRAALSQASLDNRRGHVDGRSE
jgi:hypothetical protein